MKKSILLLSFLCLTAFAGYSQQEQARTNTNLVASADNNSTTGATATPVYPGGNGAFLNFISKKIKYPAAASEDKTQGQVTVRFQVDADGSVKNAMVPKGKGIGNGCDEEAIRVVMLSPKWQPATKDGAPVSAWYEVPITFALTELK